VRLNGDFDRDGYVIERGACESSAVMWWDVWKAHYDPDRELRWNKVEVVGPFPPPLSCVPEHPSLLRTAALLLGASVSCYNYRLLVKDARSGGDVFAHQDCGYHVGSLPKLSAFVALSHVYADNGGLVFWPGTHRYGYLGDVGEIDVSGRYGVSCPPMHPGDVCYMHSALWHASLPRVGGCLRVLADVIYQRADDPARELPREGIFKRSRVSRIQELEREKRERDSGGT